MRFKCTKNSAYLTKHDCLYIYMANKIATHVGSVTLNCNIENWTTWYVFSMITSCCDKIEIDFLLYFTSCWEKKFIYMDKFEMQVSQYILRPKFHIFNLFMGGDSLPLYYCCCLKWFTLYCSIKGLCFQEFQSQSHLISGKICPKSHARYKQTVI
jgi:hypothetical protein